MYIESITNTCMKHFKRHKDYGFFDQDIRLSKLSQLGDPLEKLNTGVDFELFRKMLETNISKLAKGQVAVLLMITY